MTGIQGLEFDEDRHEYRYRGRLVPSVSGIVAPLYEFFGVSRDVLERKAAVGRAVHKACEIIDQGRAIDPDTLDPAVAPYVDGYRRFLDEVRPQVIASERFIWNEVMQYAGRLDRVYLINGRLVWVDIKTTATISPAVGVQIAGYMMASSTIGHDIADNGTRRGRASLQLTPDGGYKLRPCTNDYDSTIFISLLNIDRWRRAHA